MHDLRNGVHIGLTAIMGWLGLYLDLAHDVFATNHAFAYMSAYAPEHFWAVLFFAAANIGVLGLVANSKAARLASVLVLSTANGIFAGCLIMSGASIWSGTYAIIACMGYDLAVRRARVGL